MRAGTVYIAVWRGHGGDEIKLIGKNQVLSPGAGIQVNRLE